MTLPGGGYTASMGPVLVAATKKVVLAHGLSALDWARAGIIVVVAIAVSRLAKTLLARTINRGDAERYTGDLVARFFAYAVVIAGIVYSLSALRVRIGPLLGALGIGGLAFAFALKDTLENLIAGILLQVRRPFRRGQQVKLGAHEGTVEDVNLRVVVLRTTDGERVLLPNGSVLSGPIVNYTARGSRRTTLDIGISYEADLAKAKEIILSAVHEAEGVRHHPVPEAYVEEFGDSTINIAVRFWHAPDFASHWKVRDAVAIAVKQALDDAGIDMPFPTTFVMVRREGDAGDAGA